MLRSAYALFLVSDIGLFMAGGFDQSEASERLVIRRAVLSYLYLFYLFFNWRRRRCDAGAASLLEMHLKPVCLRCSLQL